MVEKMGFEASRRIIRVMNNKRVIETIGEQTCHFRSTFERNWAVYLQFLKEQGQIRDWYYEHNTFYFPGEKTAPVQYTPDFYVLEKDRVYYQECKGLLEGKDVNKFRRMAKHYPNDKIELVMMHIPKKGKCVNRMEAARQRVVRIIDASQIFKQVKFLYNR